MLRWSRAAVLAALVLWLGCQGGSSGPAPSGPTGTPQQIVKQGFEDIAKTGELGSGTMALRQNIDKLKTADAAKGETAAKYLKELDFLPKSQLDKIKAKAAEAAGKL